MKHPAKEAIQNDPRTLLYTAIEAKWQLSSHFAAKLAFEVPHFSVQASYRLTVHYTSATGGYLTLEDLDYNLNRRLLDNFSFTL
jgi:hypothetical protein